MTIGFYLNNIGQENVDCTHVVESNPGIGGSEYLILAIATLLTERNNDINVLLYVKECGIFPNCLNTIVVNNLDVAINISIKKGVDIFVVDFKRINNEIITRFKEKMKFVIWCHNFVPIKQLSFYSKMPNILRLITVGREQMDLYRDHPAFEKSDYIYNGVSMITIDKFKNNLPAFSERSNNVIYIGSLEECKGFYYIAKAWKKVVKTYPDANLYVVGSGKLYNRNAVLGGWGLAEENFERKFIPYLTKNNKLLPSVHFMGVMGNEKFELLSKCKVGVPNPGGDTETFGLTAVEMQSMGCLVTTIKCAGYLDTVFEKDALYDNTNLLADYIIKMLSCTENGYEKKYNFIKYNFSFDAVINQWEKLFKECIPMNSVLNDEKYFINSNFRLKKIKYYLRLKKNNNILLKFITNI